MHCRQVLLSRPAAALRNLHAEFGWGYRQPLSGGIISAHEVVVFEKCRENFQTSTSALINLRRKLQCWKTTKVGIILRRCFKPVLLVWICVIPFLFNNSLKCTFNIFLHFICSFYIICLSIPNQLLSVFKFHCIVFNAGTIKILFESLLDSYIYWIATLHVINIGIITI